MLKPKLETPPDKNFLSLQVAKEHCRVTDNDQDAFFEHLISVAQSRIDAYGGVLGRCVMPQTWSQSYGGLPSDGKFALPVGDVISIASMKYYDDLNGEQTVAASSFELVETTGISYVRMINDFQFPSLYDDRADRIKITFVAGYADADSVPPQIKHAGYMLIDHFFLHRDALNENSALSEMPLGVSSLLYTQRKQLP